MTLGIVIPFYKLSFFEETLASLAAQLNKNFRVYIGNDASPEDPLKLIESYSCELDIKYRRFEQNLGRKSLPGHWDRCIAMSRDEDYLLILGDDDVLDPHVVACFYREQESFLEKKQLVRFASAMIDKNSAITTMIYRHPREEKATDAYFRKFKGHTRSSLSEYAFPMETYIKNGFSDYPLGWHSDDRAWLEFSGQDPIYTINDAVVFIRNSGRNISSRQDNVHDKIEATYRFYQFLLKSRLEEFDTNRKYGLINSYQEFLKTNGKLKVWDWWFIARLHIVHFRLRNFKAFMKRSLSQRFISDS